MSKVRPVVLALALAVTVLVSHPPQAMADEGAGTITVETVEPTTDGRTRFVLRLTYTGDGHPARDATVTAAIVGNDGTPATPVPMSTIDQDGRYEVVLGGPDGGAWAVRFTSVIPPSTLDQPVAAETDPTNTTPASPSTEPSATSAPSGSAVAPDTSSATSPSASASPTETGLSGGGVGSGWLAAIAIVLLVLVGLVVAVRRFVVKDDAA